MPTPKRLCGCLAVWLFSLAPALGQQNYDSQGQYYQPRSNGYPNPGYTQGEAYQPAASGANQGYAGATDSQQRAIHGMSIAQWFRAYDAIRHQAQMSPVERQRADALLSKGFSILMPGDEKEATRKLLTNMVARYQRACQQLKQLPQLSQTAYLHRAYYNYFATAGQLFGDYLRVQNNLLTPDASTGQPLATGLMQRKQNLEAIEHQCKQIDANTRNQYGIAAYPW